MGTYIKKPIKIEAIQLTTKNIKEVYEFIYEKVNLSYSIDQDKWFDYECIVKEKGLHLKTLESGDGETQVADIGDFIIKGVHGEFYPCKPDIFKKTYYTQQEYAEVVG